MEGAGRNPANTRGSLEQRAALIVWGQRISFSRLFKLLMLFSGNGFIHYLNTLQTERESNMTTPLRHLQGVSWSIHPVLISWSAQNEDPLSSPA